MHAARPLPSPSFDRSRELDRRLQALVPGGAHTYAKGSDQFPEGLAPILTHGRGSRVWDVDGNEYLEFGMGLRAVTLGHGYPAVVDAVCRQATRGTNFVRPALLELEVAEQFLAMIPAAEMVKFTKDGSTANTAALKLARAYTGRERVAICADHPFYSYDDWAMVVTAVDAGIPSAVGDLTLAFPYNDLEAVEELFDRYPDSIACVMLEPERVTPPDAGYLAGLRRLCDERGALLVFDENVTGFRWSSGGAQSVHGVAPDMSTWGKGIANGFALSALAGRREVMELGGLDHDRPRVFLLSTTHGAELTGLAAGSATMTVYANEPVTETLAARGRDLRSLVAEHARRLGIDEQFRLVGRPQCLFYETRDTTGSHSAPLRTLFLQETIMRGLLAPSFVISYSHSSDDVAAAAAIIGEALVVYRDALEHGTDRFLHGRPVQSVYRRFNAPVTSP